MSSAECRVHLSFLGCIVGTMAQDVGMHTLYSVKYESIQSCCSQRTKNDHKFRNCKSKHQTSVATGRFRSPSKAS